MDKLAAVKSVQFFEGLPEDQFVKLANITITKKFARGETLFMAETKADGFYAVLSGRVKIFRTSPSGKEYILHVFDAGHAFGEVAVFEGGTFPANAQAIDSCEVLFIPREGFRKVIRDDPDMAMNMMALLSQRLRTLVHKIDDLSLKEAPSRVAAYLLLLRSAKDSDTFKLDLPKGQIAFYLGTIQETLSRIFKRFAEQGIIDMQGREIRILKMDQLQDIADEGR